MKYLSYIFIFFTYFNVIGQSNPFFQHSVNNASCNEEDGILILIANDLAISSYPFPYYVELSQEGGADRYYDLDDTEFTFDGLGKGNYSMRIWLDYENGCKVDINFNIEEQETPLDASIVFDCNTSCIDLNIETSSGPYEVAWLRRFGSAGYKMVSGWPKTNLTGNNGQEDLCDKVETGLYKVVITDAQCGQKELSIFVNPCDCFDAMLEESKNVTSCRKVIFVPVQQTCDGKLKLNISGDVIPSITWSNGSTSSEINGLCAGVYSVTLTNGTCSKVFSYEVCCCEYKSNSNFELLSCTEDGTIPQFETQVQFSNPTSSTAKDGSISLIVTGGASVKSFKWTGPNGFSSNEQNLVQLDPGVYNVTATDGCTQRTHSVTLFSCDQITFVTGANIYNSCFDANLGRIELSLSPGVSVLWKTLGGQTTPTVKFLKVGVYCADLKHNASGCESQICYTVETAAPIENLNVSNIISSCPNNNNGMATVSFTNTVTGGHNLVLMDKAINASVAMHNLYQSNISNISHTFTNLAPGEYKVILFSACEIVSKDFEITEDEFSIDYDFMLECQNSSSIQVNATGDNPPFTFKWNNGLPPVAFQSNLKRAIYKVTVTDSKGCQLDTTIREISPIFEVVSMTKACTGLWDGAITIKVNNPHNEFVSLTYGFGPGADNPNFPIAVADNFANPIIFTLSDLDGATEYEVRALINGCFEVFKFKVGEDKSSREFSKFENLGDDKILCIYDEICKDNRWDDSIEEPATLFAEEGKCDGVAGGVVFGLFSDCGNMEFFCDNEKVHEKEVGTTSVRVGEWIEWMTTTGKAHSIPWHNLGDYCSYLRVCENMPECLLGGGSWSLTGGHMVGSVLLPNGCYKIICEKDIFFLPAPDYIICGLDFLPEYIPFHYNPWPASPCKRVTKKFAEVVHFKEYLSNKYDTLFTNSSLYEELNKYKNDPRIYCSNITFCVCSSSDCDDHFEFHSSDILDVECSFFDPPCQDNLFSTGLIDASCVSALVLGSNNAINYAYCEKENCENEDVCDCIEPVLLNLVDSTKFNLNRYNDLPDVVLFKTKINTRFERFSKTKLVSNYHTSDGIFKTDTRTRFYHSFDTERWVYNINKEAEFAYQDYTTKQGMLVKKSSPFSYTLYNTQSMNSPTTFNYNSIYNVEGTTGSNNGIFSKMTLTDLSLYQNNYLLNGRTDTSSFQVLLSNTNNIVRKQTISGFIDSTYLVTGKGFSTFVTRVPGSKIKVNNTIINTNFFSKSSLVTIKDIYNGGVEISELVSWVKTNRLVKVEENFATGQDTYIFTGYGGLDFGTSYIPETNQESLYIISYKKGVVFWKIIPLVPPFNTKDISITSDDDGNVYIGINFTGNFKSPDFDLNSNGSYDIALLKYKKDGLFLGYKQFGSVDNEILKDIYFESNLIHLGGDLEGETTFRKIGELTFAKFDTLQNHAFISLTSAIDFNSSVVQIREKKSIFSPESFILTPNPTNGLVEIVLDKPLSSVLKVNVNTMDGKMVFSTLLSKNEFDNQNFVLQLSDLPSGVYSVTLLSEHKVIETKKLIKI